MTSDFYTKSNFFCYGVLFTLLIIFVSFVVGNYFNEQYPQQNKDNGLMTNSYVCYQDGFIQKDLKIPYCSQIAIQPIPKEDYTFYTGFNAEKMDDAIRQRGTDKAWSCIQIDYNLAWCMTGNIKRIAKNGVEQ